MKLSKKIDPIINDVKQLYAENDRLKAELAEVKRTYPSE
jgi:hypothetical protein